ncbi:MULTISPECIES: GvpL/GvpF family gas vesicle protein [unclassified Streptomyces]|uniref:GvpL/GvpF family gas vesicle protein n=1 Tax=unclassified Streptomyces TaxID=2593676 RepID=UPI00081DA2B0|nr:MULTISPECIES: GvpL/GvpF family gas vesicle protein [unclassified Streptomyces]MYR24621.1 gas vesicle protein [Streptomyces sp. SID4945]SCE64286.1 Gas vesicle synthesis protein GvpL/GvpF [Streptomyces sp. LcepLS]
MTDAATAVCVFAVRRGRGPALPAGLTGHSDGGEVRLMAAGDLWAVVQEVPAAGYDDAALRARCADPAELERLARTHHAVVSAAAAEWRAVPLPLATLYHDEHGARTGLLAHADRFDTVLRRVAEHAEWAVKVHREAPAASPAPQPSGRPLGGRDYLDRVRARQRAQESGHETALRIADQVDNAAREVAAEGVRRPLHGKEVTGEKRSQVLNGAYLVPLAKATAFTERIAREREALPAGCTLELAGPWVPYSFTGEPA